MVLNKYFSLLIVAILVAFVACSKDQETTVSPAPLSAAEYLQKNAYSPIIFHYSYINEDTQEQSGWFVDKWGAVKTYQTTLQDPKAIPEEEQCGAHLIDNLYALASHTPAQINLDELAEKFKLIQEAQKGQLATLQSNSTTELSAFYAFQFEENYEGTTHCYNDDGELVDVFNRVVLKTTGKQHQNNLSAEAQDILDWLLLVKENHHL